ncbi:hypothetical protein DFH06DRAFT_1291226 [Mycena polygramma]|nr:hypothetical protein DFH06DRAFT_1291226 [Mycena polygramma]
MSIQSGAIYKLVNEKARNCLDLLAAASAVPQRILIVRLHLLRNDQISATRCECESLISRLTPLSAFSVTSSATRQQNGPRGERSTTQWAKRRALAPRSGPSGEREAPRQRSGSGVETPAVRAGARAVRPKEGGLGGTPFPPACSVADVRFGPVFDQKIRTSNPTSGSVRATFANPESDLGPVHFWGSNMFEPKRNSHELKLFMKRMGSVGSERFGQILKNPNPELDLGVRFVQVRFRFEIGSEPNTGNTTSTVACPTRRRSLTIRNFKTNKHLGTESDANDQIPVVGVDSP